MKNIEYYDVAIIGSGPAGIFCAYELITKNPKLNIILIDKGKKLENRSCPVKNKILEKCPLGGCKPACAVTNGFGGAGAFSDGKFNITTNYGGWLGDYIDNSELLELIKYVDSINMQFGAPDTIVYQDGDFVRRFEQLGASAGLALLRTNVRHLGTEENLKILNNIYQYMEDKVKIVHETLISDIFSLGNGVFELENDGYKIQAKNLVVVPGRDGSAWLGNILKKFGIPTTVNQVDIGVRVETSDIVMYDVNKYLYEGKFIFNSSVGKKVRTFCSNPSGWVVIENHSGVMCANGHAYNDPSLGSKNTNFALLVSHKFTQPFNKPNEYAREICQRANDLSDGGVILQRFGDLIKGRRSTEKRIDEGFIQPTLKEAVPGDLGLVLPYNTMKSLIEMIYALDKVTPGIASEHTLLYGVEAKFYSERPILKNNLETKIDGLYCGGDGAGITRGLAMASASGVHIARDILKKVELWI